MKKYNRPQIEIAEADLVLLSVSGPGANDIGSPSVRTKSVWDEEESDNTIFNIREESYEDKVYE